jgi:hypothetical protein
MGAIYYIHSWTLAHSQDVQGRLSLGGVADVIQGHLEVDSKSMAADLNAIMKEAGWLGVSFSCRAENRIPAWRMG